MSFSSWCARGSACISSGPSPGASRAQAFRRPMRPCGRLVPVQSSRDSSRLQDEEPERVQGELTNPPRFSAEEKARSFGSISRTGNPFPTCATSTAFSRACLRPATPAHGEHGLGPRGWRRSPTTQRPGSEAGGTVAAAAGIRKPNAPRIPHALALLLRTKRKFLLQSRLRDRL